MSAAVSSMRKDYQAAMLQRKVRVQYILFVDQEFIKESKRIIYQVVLIIIIIII